MRIILLKSTRKALNEETVSQAGVCVVKSRKQESSKLFQSLFKSSCIPYQMYMDIYVLAGYYEVAYGLSGSVSYLVTTRNC